MVKGELGKPGAVVIDVGVNRVDDATKKEAIAWWVTLRLMKSKKLPAQLHPVPGGVGPMTIAMLLRNTLNASKFTDS
jgi:5,10-methylene-tetrahydrofolate dehydrogenase/methenyl tetrahydrofolate cyclohydrolase